MDPSPADSGTSERGAPPASALQRALDGANRALIAAGAVGIVAMMLHTAANAVARAVLGAPLTGTNEMVTYWYMPLVALIGFVVAQRDGTHTEARLLFDRMPRATRLEVRVGGLLLAAAMCAGFGGFGLAEAVHGHRLGLAGGVMQVTMWPVLYLVAATYAVLTLQMLAEAASVVLRARARRIHGDDRERPDAGA
ncbi:TRAP transporter small permease [Nocardiopsis coralliicola]